MSPGVKSTDMNLLRLCSDCSVLIQPKQPLLKCTSTAGTFSRTSVSSSPADMPSEPSPNSATGRASGRANQAPTTAGIA